ncbi:transglycosylase SLT domain-containing protein [Jannaschia sp.]|nr:transglycosylase SLT domain-containing protein [Jannaschia sp.]
MFRVPFAVAAAALSLSSPAISQVITPQFGPDRLSAAALGRVVPVPRPTRVSAPFVSPDALENEDLALMAERLLREEASLDDGDVLIEAVLQPRTGGLDAIRERGFLRMAVAPDPLMIAYDGERALGIAMEIARELELFMADRPDASATPTVVVPTPMPRRAIADNVDDGLTDFSTLTVTQAEEDPELTYTRPLIEGVNDVVVLGEGVNGVEEIDDLAGLPIYLSEDGRYARNAQGLNDRRVALGKPPLDLRFVDGRLDDYDLIEMVEIGLIPATIATDFKARFWQTVYPSIVVRDDMPLTRDARIAWVLRADNPELADVLNGFAEIARKGTLLGNIVLQRYASSAEWIENIGADDAQSRLDEVAPVIAHYAERYGFDADLLMAQAYQESRLDQTRRSHVGAIGVMQVMPTTAADPVVGIPDVTALEENVHAGVKYLRWLRDTFFDDPAIDPLDQSLLAFAAYNAGPGGVRRAQRTAHEMGLDPHVWFENVEVAIQRSVSREPAIYVRNIFKYYVSYRLLADLRAEAETVRGALRDRLETVPDAVASDGIGAGANLR